MAAGPWSYPPGSLELRGAGSGYICSLGTSESWIKGIPGPTASVLPNPTVKRKGHLLSSSEAVRKGTPKRRLQDYKQGRHRAQILERHFSHTNELLKSVPTGLESPSKPVPTVLHTAEEGGSSRPDTHSLHYHPPGLFSPLSVPNLDEGLTSQLTEHQT